MSAASGIGVRKDDFGALNVYLYALCHDRAGGALLSGYGA
jgi:hypothetical protein